MKKTLLISLFALVASPAFAGTFNSSDTASSPTDISTTDCALLSAAVRVNTSAANVGTYICNSGTASIGVAIANKNGKRKVYSASSAGGGITAADIAGTSTITASDTTTPATTAAASS